MFCQVPRHRLDALDDCSLEISLLEFDFHHFTDFLPIRGKLFAITPTTALNSVTIMHEVTAPPPRGTRNDAVFVGTSLISQLRFPDA
jgi:hypothetical protein